MISRIRDLASGTINRISENHLISVHRKMALSSLKEHDECCKLTKQEIKAIDSLWKPIGYRGKGEWHRLYKATNSFDARYVPNDVYGLEIWPRLNATNLIPAWDDKAYYSRFFPEVKQPSVIAFMIDGLFYDKDYKIADIESVSKTILKGFDKIIVKPSYGMEGRGVELIETGKHDYISLKEKLQNFGTNYVVQQVVEQHESLAIYNDSSVNIIRVYTLRLNGKLHHLHSTLRFGTPGFHTDVNFIKGKEIAHVCAVNKAGKVAKEWYDMDGRRNLISDLGIEKQMDIPNFSKIIDTALTVHEGLQHFDIVGFDITLDRHKEPVLIEYNVYWPGIILPQYCNGPLFGDLTEEVIIQLLSKSKK
ncbi:MAG: hypothetical protein IKG85_01690 [Clostridia bacterium]|nr:hypothetical protein [Clostridia bacterium]